MRSDLALLQRLQDAISQKADSIPAGFKPSEDWAKAWRKSISRTRELLRQGVAAGIIVRKSFRVTKGGIPVPHYKPK